MRLPLFPKYVRTAILYFIALEVLCFLGRGLLVYAFSGSFAGNTMLIPVQEKLWYSTFKFAIGLGPYFICGNTYNYNGL